MNITAVVMELIVEGYVLMALFSDGSMKEFNMGWGRPSDLELRRWKYLTVDQLRQELADHQGILRGETNSRLHAKKVQQLGWDYELRGYK